MSPFHRQVTILTAAPLSVLSVQNSLSHFFDFLVFVLTLDSSTLRSEETNTISLLSIFPQTLPIERRRMCDAISSLSSQVQHLGDEVDEINSCVVRLDRCVKALQLDGDHPRRVCTEAESSQLATVQSESATATDTTLQNELTRLRQAEHARLESDNARLAEQVRALEVSRESCLREAREDRLQLERALGDMRQELARATADQKLALETHRNSTARLDQYYRQRETQTQAELLQTKRTLEHRTHALQKTEKQLQLIIITRLMKEQEERETAERSRLRWRADDW